MNINEQQGGYPPTTLIEQQNVNYAKPSFGQTIGGIIATSGGALLGLLLGAASIIAACRF